jgi:hypothetical protein
MVRDGDEWLYVQGVTLGGQTGVRVQRYREAPADVLLPDDVKAALQRRDVSVTMQARAAAAAPLATEDVIEASRHLDTPVLEAWLVERGEPFALNAKSLVTLADAGVASRVIDLMVALSYPNVFAINAASRQGERRPRTLIGSGGRTYGGYGVPSYTYAIDQCSMFYMLWAYVPYECGGFYPYAYGSYGFGGYGFGFYPGGYPVEIVFTGSSRAHGRVVNGQGYKEGSGTTSATPSASDRGRVTPSGWSPSGPSGSSTSTKSSGSGGGEQRTAHPRP